MPTPNRNRYSDDYGGGSSAIRTLGAFLLCAVLSFALGFFVLARFWSSKPKADGDGLDKNVVASAGDRTPAQHGDDTPVRQHASLPSVQPTPHPTIGPRIDPEEDVQKPANLDQNKEAKRPTGSSGDDVIAPSDGSGKPEDTPKPADTATPPPTPTEDSKGKRHKKPAMSEETQPSKSPDDESAPPESTDDVNDVHAAHRKHTTPKAVVETTGGLFRVQIGVYSTREKAEEQARSASDRGFETTIHPVTSGDRTLYRVQHSAHRTRANAEAEKQRLVDAGFDAYIANP